MPASPTSSQTHYEALEIAEDATEDQIKAAWRRLALKYHPDKLNSCSPEEKEEGDRIFMRARQAHDVLMDKKKRKDYDRELKRYGADPAERQQTLSVQLWMIGGRSERPMPGKEMERMKNQIIMAVRKEFGDMSDLRVHDRGPAYTEVDRKKVDERFRNKTKVELFIPGERNLILKILISNKDNEARTRAGMPAKPLDRTDERRSPRRRSEYKSASPRRRSPVRRNTSRSRSRPRRSRSRSPRKPSPRKSPPRKSPPRKSSPVRKKARPNDCSRSRSPPKDRFEENKMREEVQRMKAELECLKKQREVEEQLLKARRELDQKPVLPKVSENGIPKPPKTAGSSGEMCCWHCQAMCEDGDFCGNCGGCLFRQGVGLRRPQLCAEGVIYCSRCGVKGLRRKHCPTCGFENPIFDK